MLEKSITYTDYNGNKRTETFLFNLSKQEIHAMELSTTGGMEEYVNRIIKAEKGKEIVDLFSELILKAYGEKSLDGKRFIKSRELREAFSQTEAFSELYMELVTDAKAAAEFVNGILPLTPEQSEQAMKIADSIMQQNN